MAGDARWVYGWADEGGPEQGWDIHSDPPDNSVGTAIHATTGSEEKARRIVACVNALAGVPTEALEAGALAKALAWGADCASGEIDTSYGVPGEVVELFRALGKDAP